MAESLHSHSTEAATINLRNLTEHFGVEWAKTSIVPRILAMHSNANYLHRLTSLHAVKVLAEAMNADTIQTMLIPLVVELAQVWQRSIRFSSSDVCRLTICSSNTQDPVPNIRFNVAKTLEAIGGKVDAAALANTVKPCLQALQQDADSDVVFFATRALSKC